MDKQEAMSLYSLECTECREVYDFPPCGECTNVIAMECIEKQIPRKPQLINGVERYCPRCYENKRYFPVNNKYFGISLNPMYEEEIRKITYCKHCGQAILWESDNE